MFTLKKNYYIYNINHNKTKKNGKMKGSANKERQILKTSNRLTKIKGEIETLIDVKIGDIINTTYSDALAFDLQSVIEDLNNAISNLEIIIDNADGGEYFATEEDFEN
jgi:hypothetical protein